MAKLTKKARNAIATLTTGGVGTHYTSTGSFFSRLEWVLRENGMKPEVEEYPPIHTTDGRGRMSVTMIGSEVPLFDVVFVWHRMEETGNWEMTCYPSC